MTTLTDYTARVEACVATCPSPAVAYAVIAGLMLDYTMAEAAKAADVSLGDALAYRVSMHRAMCDSSGFPEAAQEALRAALKRRVEA